MISAPMPDAGGRCVETDTASDTDSVQSKNPRTLAGPGIAI